MIKAVVFDMDGVLFRGRKPLPHAAETLDELRRRKIAVFFFTNNATKTRMQYCRKLRRMGISAHVSEIYTSAYGTAAYMKEHGFRGRVLVVGEYGLRKELASAGFSVVSSPPADFVVAGLDRKFNYGKLANAFLALKSGARFIATNSNPTLPLEEKVAPGSAAMIEAISACSRMKPEVIVGKPNAYILRKIAASARAEPGELAVVGDSIENDIALANRFRALSILVLTGVSNEKDARAAKGENKPKLVIKDLGGLIGKISG